LLNSEEVVDFSEKARGKDVIVSKRATIDIANETEHELIRNERGGVNLHWRNRIARRDSPIKGESLIQGRIRCGAVINEKGDDCKGEGSCGWPLGNPWKGDVSW